jgi:hypothetical protein
VGSGEPSSAHHRYRLIDFLPTSATALPRHCQNDRAQHEIPFACAVDVSYRAAGLSAGTVSNYVTQHLQQTAVADHIETMLRARKAGLG